VTIMSWRWAGSAASMVASAVTAALTGLLVWTMLPLVLGWQPSVVLTGSMMPRIRPGDIVVTKPVDPAQLRVKQVVRFADPAVPGRHLMHRISYIRGNGTIITRGDANGAADSTPVPVAQVDGVALLRIPYVGLPVVWLRERQYGHLGLGALLTLLLAYGISHRPRTESVIGSHRAGRHRVSWRELRQTRTST
jgi:signal peptidase